jgi:hypothetical protein
VPCASIHSFAMFPSFFPDHENFFIFSHHIVVADCLLTLGTR